MSPSAGPRGTILTIAGALWGAGETVTLTWGSATLIDTVAVSQAGAFSINYFVPSGAVIGQQYTITGVGSLTKDTAQGTFLVTAQALPTGTPTPVDTPTVTNTPADTAVPTVTNTPMDTATGTTTPTDTAPATATNTVPPSATVLCGGALPSSIDGRYELSSGCGAYNTNGTTVQGDGTLIMDAGVVVTFNGGGSQLYVYGTLTTLGTPADPVRLQGTSNSQGSWQGVLINGGNATGNLAGLTIMYAGSNQPALYVVGGATVTLSNGWVDYSNNQGVYVSDLGTTVTLTNDSIWNSRTDGVDYVNNAIPEVTNSSVSYNGGNGLSVSIWNGNNMLWLTGGTIWQHYPGQRRRRPVLHRLRDQQSRVGADCTHDHEQRAHAQQRLGGRDLRADVLSPSLDSNTLSGNGFNAIGMDGTITQNWTWGSGPTYVVEHQQISYDNGQPGLMVASGATLTLSAGTVMKFNPNTWCCWGTNQRPQLVVNGTLNAQGAPGHPVVFTSIFDNRYGGPVRTDRGPQTAIGTASCSTAPLRVQGFRMTWWRMAACTSTPAPHRRSTARRSSTAAGRGSTYRATQAWWRSRTTRS